MQIDEDRRMGKQSNYKDFKKITDDFERAYINSFVAEKVECG